MFSNNHKISIRQIRRLLFLDLFGIGSLLLPSRLAHIAGIDGVFCIGAAMLLALVYLWILGKVQKQIRGNYYSYMKHVAGTAVSDICMLFYLFFFLLLSAYTLYQLTGLIRGWLLPEGKYSWISALLLLFVFYASIRGLEGRARIYEILFWLLFGPLFLMLLLAARDVNVNYWTPVFVLAPLQFAKGTMLAFLFFLPVFLVLFLPPYCNRPRRLIPCAAGTVLLSSGLLSAIYLILMGIFQANALSVLPRPVITLMSMVKLPGGFFARMDAFMTAIWFFSLFALINTGIFYSSHILEELFHEKETHYCLMAVLIAAFAMGQYFFRFTGALALFEQYILYAAFPVLVLLPIFFLLLERIRHIRKKGGEKP